jgi:hypothetical protein
MVGEEVISLTALERYRDSILSVCVCVRANFMLYLISKKEYSDSRAYSSFSLTSKGLFTNNSSWKKKEIPHTTVTFYGDCMKMWEDFAPNFDGKRTGYYITTTYPLTRRFSPGNLWPKTTWLSSRTDPTFICLPYWRWNWKAAILTQFRWWRQNRRRSWTPSRNSTNRMY